MLTTPRTRTAKKVPPATLPASAPAPRHRPLVDGCLDYPVDLVLDGRLSSTTRLILGGLTHRGSAGVVSWQTDEQIAELHGVTPRVAQSALRDGELAGWVARMGPEEFRRWARQLGQPALYERLPRQARVAKRLVVLLWRLPDTFEDLRVPSADPEEKCEVPVEGKCEVHPAPKREVDRPTRKRSASTSVPPRSALPVHPEAICEPSRACASLSRINEGINENVLVPPLSPMPAETPIPGTDRAIKHLWAQLIAQAEREEAAAAAEAPAPVAPATPTPTPRMATWTPQVGQGVPTKATANRDRRLRAEELVAALVGPDGEAALNALLVFLAAQLRDAKPESRQFWSDRIPIFAATEAGRADLLELIRKAGAKGQPARWFSACLARGRPEVPEAHKATPGPTRQSAPGAALDRLSRAPHNCIRGRTP